MNREKMEAELKRLEALPESKITEGRILFMRTILGKKKEAPKEGETQYDWEKEGEAKT